MRSRRRYSRARSVFHERKTASIARSSCSRGSCGKSAPVCSITMSLYAETTSFRSSAPSSRSVVAPTFSFRASSASENGSPGMSSTVRAEHLDQSAVGVPGEPLVVGELRQRLDRLVVQADVEDGLHHPRHRELRAGAHRHQQRLVRIAEVAADGLLDLAHRDRGLDLHRARQAALGEVGAAGVGGDGEARRDRHAQVGHLGEVRALAAEELLLVLVSLAEPIDVLGHGCSPSLLLHAYHQLRRGAPCGSLNFAEWHEPRPRDDHRGPSPLGVVPRVGTWPASSSPAPPASSAAGSCPRWSSRATTCGR